MSRRILVRDLILPANIGVYPHEHAVRQRVCINLDLEVADTPATTLASVVDYAAITNRVRAIVAAGHVHLVETLAERIAETCLIDARVELARIRVEKLDVFADAASAGVAIERRRQ